MSHDAWVDVLNGCLKTALDDGRRAGWATVRTDDGQYACWAWQPMTPKWFCIASGVDFSEAEARQKADDRLVDEILRWRAQHDPCAGAPASEEGTT